VTGERGAAVELVKARLQEFGSRGGPVKWQCPAEGHDDQDPSLTVTQGAKGALVRCRSNECDLDDILAALKLSKRDLFDAPQERDRECRRHDYKRVTFYEYASADGSAVVQKVERKHCSRCGDKTFLPWRPTAAGGWECKAPAPKDRVPYRLDEVLRAKDRGDEILLNEGEKSCDRARAAGLIATSFPGGAPTTLLPQYARMNSGARIAIVADRDPAGQKCALARHEFLRAVADVRVVLPAVTSPKADLYDHLDAGFGLDDLEPVEPGPQADDADPEKPPTKLAGLALDPENQATQIIELASKGFDLFCSPDGRAWAIDRAGPNIAIPIARRSSKFSKRLARRFVEEHQKAPGEQAVCDAVRIITAFLDDEDPQPVFLRTARHDGGIVLDLGRSDGQCVVVTAGGWKVEPRSPVPFRRGKTGPLPIPVRSTNGLQLLRKLCNVSDNTFRLIVGCLVAYLVPGIPYVVMVIRGEQGRAKSTLAKILIRCIDPGRDPGPLPRDERNFSIRMWNGHVHAFDYVSDIAPYQSDMICRAATGADFGERTLYENDELTSMPYCCPIILNGIDLGAVPPDLADREVTVEPTPIKRRRTEHTVLGGSDDDDQGVLDEFAQAQPKILGVLLDLLSGVLTYSPAVSKADLPRMADFAVVLGALDRRYEAIHGKPHTEPLLDLYRAMARKVVAEAARDDILGSAILTFMGDKDEWEGTSSGLYEALTARLPKPAPEKLPKGWPANFLSFGHRLPKINPALRANGWEVIRGEHSVHGRPVRIQPCTVSGAKPSGPSDHQRGYPDLPEPPDGPPDDSPDGLLADGDDATAESLADGLRDGAPEQSISGETAGHGVSSDGLDGLTVSPQIDGGVERDGAALTLIRHRLGGEVIETITNGQEPGPCIASGCPRNARHGCATCWEHATQYEPRESA
jgi:hypothetical protein